MPRAVPPRSPSSSTALRSPVSLPGAGRATARPAAALSSGAHTLSWSAVDAVGNRTVGSTSFAVPDTTAPTFGKPEPEAGSTLGDGDVLSISVAATDEGSGIDPASVDLELDGTPVEHVWRTGDVVHGVAGRQLLAGTHHLVLTVADLAGNAARLAWDIVVVGTAGTAAGTAPASAGATGPAGAPGAKWLPWLGGRGCSRAEACGCRTRVRRTGRRYEAACGRRPPARTATPAHRAARALRSDRAHAAGACERPRDRDRSRRLRRSRDRAAGGRAGPRARPYRLPPSAAPLASDSAAPLGADRRACERSPGRVARTRPRPRGALVHRLAPCRPGSRRRRPAASPARSPSCTPASSRCAPASPAWPGTRARRSCSRCAEIQRQLGLTSGGRSGLRDDGPRGAPARHCQGEQRARRRARRLRSRPQGRGRRRIPGR